jgi:radical SAM superfamily enzyme YgiQ (UPF0313 family)
MNYLFVMPKNAAKSSGGYNVFPVGIAYISAFLKNANMNVMTANLEFYAEDTFNSLRGLISEKGIDVLCTSGLSRDYAKIKEIIDCARWAKRSILTVVGGGIITGDPQPAMASLEADIGVVGEGERTMLDLARALDKKESYETVPGLIFRNALGEYTQTAGREEIENIDSIPLPDYDGFAFSEYMQSIHYEAAYVIASRSCPFSCTFCFHPSGKKYRQRSLDSLFSEIEFLVDRYRIHHLIVSDELFANQRERVLQFCQRIRTYKIKWSVQLRVCDVDREMLEAMREAGCVCISYGIESADNAVLKSMRKHISVAQIEKALKDTYDANIDIQGGFIFGDVAETRETADKTLKWHSEHPHYGLELNMIQIFPGTGLYKNGCSRGIIEDRVKYLKEGCPQTNVSRLSKEEYISLSSLVYERNMRAKYLPEKYGITAADGNGHVTVEITCDKCGTASSWQMDLLHIKRTNCPNCLQRYYVDPFQKIGHDEAAMRGHFGEEDAVIIWGAGEICIKLLDHYVLFHEEKFIVVDISRSRQGYTVCGKRIMPPGVIGDKQAKSVIVAVMQRKDEVWEELGKKYPTVKRVYLPHVERKEMGFVLRMKQISRADKGDEWIYPDPLKGSVAGLMRRGMEMRGLGFKG